jgi:hypothetical protein
MSEPKQDQDFQRLLAQYFPRDAVRIKEDVRIADFGRSRGHRDGLDSALAQLQNDPENPR